jgi:hypothetical protein
VNVAVTVEALETEQVVLFEAVQPLHPAKVKPWFGVAVNVVLPLNVAWQVPEFVPAPKAEQLIPLGVLVMLPIPPPDVFTMTSSGVPPGVVPGARPTQPLNERINKTTSGR